MAVRSLKNSGLHNFEGSSNSMLTGYSFNDFHHLQTVQLGGNTASVTFSNLLQYSGEFTHLQIRFVARTNRADVGETVRVQFNEDASSSYRSHLLAGAGSSVFSFAQNQSTSYEIYRIAGGSDAASAFGAGVLDILDPFIATKNTTTRALAGSSASYREIGLNSGLYMSTAAINVVNLAGGNGSFVAGSRFSLYGIR